MRSTTMNRSQWKIALAGITMAVTATSIADEGPNSSLYSSRMVAAQESIPPGPPVGGSFPLGGQPTARPSWYEIPSPPPKEVKINDIITIRVDTGARLSESAQMQRRRTSQYDARLNDWIILEGLGAIK